MLGYEYEPVNRSKKEAKEELPPVPSEFQEAVVLTSQVTKLQTKIAAITSQIVHLEQEREALQKELLQYKPLLDKMRLLQEEVRKIRQGGA